MANKRSSKQDLEKALNAKSKELGKKPTDGSIYSWLTDVGAHTNTHNYDIARAWQEGFQERKPFARDDVPDSDIANLREAQRDAAATYEQSYRRIYSAAVEKIRSEAQMRVDAATGRVAENEVERDFLLTSWRSTESELDESRRRMETLERELEDARLEIAGLKGRIAASDDLIGRLTGSFPRIGDVDYATAPIDAEVAGDLGAIGDGSVALAEQHPIDAIAPTPVKLEPAGLARQLMYGPTEDNNADSDRVGDVEADPTDRGSSAMMADADPDKDQSPAIATPASAAAQIALPIADSATIVEADRGDDDRS